MSYEKAKKYIEEHATPKEIDAFRAGHEPLVPRKGYVEGTLKLNIEHRLPGGEILKASEDEKGIVTVVIEKNDGTTIDLQSCLPTGFKFVSPTYFWKENSDGGGVEVGEFG